MEKPHILSNPAARFVTEKSAHSIFSVRSCPRGQKFPKDTVAQNEYLKIVRRDYSKEEEKQKSDSWSTVKKFHRLATGFAFENRKDRLLILTAAHTIQEAYRDKFPLDNSHIGSLNIAYFFLVMCIHKGREVLLDGKQPDHRNYLPATVVAIDSRLDLMLLEVDPIKLGLICPLEHRTICGVAESPAPKAETVLLQGWPRDKCDTSVWGNIGTVRDYKWLTRNNPLGYRMRLTELPGMECEDGCSGGPLVDGRLQCVGVSNSNLNHCGYAVSVPDIRDFVESYDMMGPPPPPPLPPAAASKGHEDTKAKHVDPAKDKGLKQGHRDTTDEPGSGKEEESKRRRVLRLEAMSDDE